MKEPYALTALGMVCSLGSTLEAIRNRLAVGDKERLTFVSLRTAEARVPVGMVLEELPAIPEDLARFRCRNHALAYAALLGIEGQVTALRERMGPERVGVVLGSSTSGIDATESAFDQWRTGGSLPGHYHLASQHEMAGVSDFVARASGARGPAFTVSTACSSSAKAFGSAANLLDLGVCDAVIVGGVDTLCDITLNGFEALASLSRRASNPMSRNRDGLNIGEGAALFILTREEGPIRLLGVGESSDAYHISAPDPEGAGAEAAMRAALEQAGLAAADIDYLNLHGTGTPLNDSMEAKAVSRVFRPETWCSSTKPMTGHCLGAAGAIEAGICWLTLRGSLEGLSSLPVHCWDGMPDASMPQLRLADRSMERAKRCVRVMSNSFAFGGSNCSLILGLAS